MATALFVLGASGSGKTNLSKKFIKSRLAEGEHWVLIDKDTVGELFSNKILSLLSTNTDDRDSPIFLEHVRDLEYKTALMLAASNLKLGISVVLPGPWTKEINDNTIFNKDSLGFPQDSILGHVYLSPPSFKLKSRIENRDNPKDKWKLDHWEEYSKRVGKPKGISENKILTFNMFEEYYQQEYQLLKMIRNNTENI